MGVNWGAMVVWIIVLCVLITVARYYLRSRKLLRELVERIAAEDEALNKTRDRLNTVKVAGLEPDTARQVAAALVGEIPADCAVKRRLNLLMSAEKRRRIAPLDRPSMTMEEAARWQGATEEPRFWAGAFVFMGLLGTLAGLAVSVIHLMSIVSNTASSEGFEAKMESMLPTMRDTFASMGGAFASTAIGVLATLVLSHQIHLRERQTDEFLQRLERLSFDHLEMLASRLLNDLSDRQSAQSVAATAQMLAKVEQIVQAFTETLKGAVNVLTRISDNTASTSARWDVAASTFDAATQHLESGASRLGERIESLDAVLMHGQKSQQDTQAALLVALNYIETTLSLVQTTVNDAQDVFSRLDGYHESLQSEHKTLLDAIDVRLAQGTRNMGEAAHALQSDVARLAQIHGEQMRDSQKLWRDAYFALQQEWPKAVARMNDVLQENVAEERRIADSLEGTLSHLRNYAEHVENVIHDLPAALQAGPLIAYDKQQNEAFVETSVAVTKSAEAVTQSSEAVTETLTQMAALRQETATLNDTLRSVGKTLAQVRAELNSTHDLSEEVSRTGIHLNGLSSRILQMNGHLEKLLDHPTIILPSLRRAQNKE